MYGAGTLMAFVAWLIVLVTGKLPPSLHLAYVAAIRFMTRYYGYLSMLTPAYPNGLYGDNPGTVAWADQPPTTETQGFGSPQGYGAPPGYGASGYGASAGYGVPAPGYGAPAGYGVPGGYGVRPVFQPASWRLTLTSAAKGLITTFIAIGSLVVIGIAVLNFVVGNSTSNTVSAASAIEQLSTANLSLGSNLGTWEHATKNCNHVLTCVTREDTKAASAYGTFATQVAASQVPSDATADKARVVAAATTAQRDFTQLSKTTSVSQYESTISIDGLQQTMDAVDQDTSALVNHLQDELAG